MFLTKPNDGKDITKELVYNVFRQDMNTKLIEIYNVFNSSKFYDGLVKTIEVYRNTQDQETLREELRCLLYYAFGSKCEYELVLTSWPPYMDVQHIAELQKEVEEHDKKWGWKQVRVNVPLTVHNKVDVYTQVLMNFDHFFNYILNNISLIISEN